MPDENVKALFGTWEPSAGTTGIIKERARHAYEAVEERRMVAFGAVAIDEDGQAHMFFGHDPCRDTVLIGGLALLKSILCRMVNTDDATSTPPAKEPS